MSDAVIVALISGGTALLGTVITVVFSHMKIIHDFRVSQAVIETKIEGLTNDVRKHNNFAERVPVVEEQIKVANHRIADLERKGA